MTNEAIATTTIPAPATSQRRPGRRRDAVAPDGAGSATAATPVAGSVAAGSDGDDDGGVVGPLSDGHACVGLSARSGLGAVADGASDAAVGGTPEPAAAPGSGTLPGSSGVRGSVMARVPPLAPAHEAGHR